MFQSYNLLPKTTAIENVELPLLYNKNITSTQSRQKSIEALTEVGLADRLYHRSTRCPVASNSVAIARALVNDPVIILADGRPVIWIRAHPTDTGSLPKLHKEGKTIIFVTHNPEIASFSGRTMVLKDGRVIHDTPNMKIASAKAVLDTLPVEEEEEDIARHIV